MSRVVPYLIFKQGAAGRWRTRCQPFAIRALRQAVVTHQPTPGLVHHSDRGVQYVSGEYVQLLHEQTGKPLR